MNAIRERILIDMTPYMDYAKHKDLISFCVSSECFMDIDDEDNGIEPDFNEVVAIVEKDWLFNRMDMENPLEYLQNEYTSDDSIAWFDDAMSDNKVVMIGFN